MIRRVRCFHQGLLPEPLLLEKGESCEIFTQSRFQSNRRRPTRRGGRRTAEGAVVREGEESAQVAAPSPRLPSCFSVRPAWSSRSSL